MVLLWRLGDCETARGHFIIIIMEARGCRINRAREEAVNWICWFLCDSVLVD